MGLSVMMKRKVRNHVVIDFCLIISRLFDVLHPLTSQHSDPWRPLVRERIADGLLGCQVSDSSTHISIKQTERHIDANNGQIGFAAKTKNTTQVKILRNGSLRVLRPVLHRALPLTSNLSHYGYQFRHPLHHCSQLPNPQLLNRGHLIRVLMRHGHLPQTRGRHPRPLSQTPHSLLQSPHHRQLQDAVHRAYTREDDEDGPEEAADGNNSTSSEPASSSGSLTAPTGSASSLSSSSSPFKLTLELPTAT
jgi:hypothetical protein